MHAQERENVFPCIGCMMHGVGEWLFFFKRNEAPTTHSSHHTCALHGARGEITGSASGHVRTWLREAFPICPRRPRAPLLATFERRWRREAIRPSHLGVAPHDHQTRTVRQAPARVSVPALWMSALPAGAGPTEVGWRGRGTEVSPPPTPVPSVGVSRGEAHTMSMHSQARKHARRRMHMSDSSPD